MGYALIEVTDAADWAAYHLIRRQELFEPRALSYDENFPNERAPGAHPYLLKCDGAPIGTTRLDVRANGSAIVRLVAITAAAQGKGHGRVLGQLVEDRARALGVGTLYVNAANTALGYYQRTGWSEHVWDAAELVGIAENCTQMRKAL